MKEELGTQRPAHTNFKRYLQIPLQKSCSTVFRYQFPCVINPSAFPQFSSCPLIALCLLIMSTILIKNYIYLSAYLFIGVCARYRCVTVCIWQSHRQDVARVSSPLEIGLRYGARVFGLGRKYLYSLRQLTGLDFNQKHLLLYFCVWERMYVCAGMCLHACMCGGRRSISTSSSMVLHLISEIVSL